MEQKNLDINIIRNPDNEIPTNNEDIVYNKGKLEKTIEGFSLNSDSESNELPKIPITIMYIGKTDGLEVYAVTPEPENVSKGIEGEHYKNG